MISMEIIILKNMNFLKCYIIILMKILINLQIYGKNFYLKHIKIKMIEIKEKVYKIYLINLMFSILILENQAFLFLMIENNFLQYKCLYLKFNNKFSNQKFFNQF